MNWQALIQPGPVWSGVLLYADERISELTVICTTAQSSEAQIRQAQSGIEEMRRLKGLMETQRAAAEQSKAPRRREY